MPSRPGLHRPKSNWSRNWPAALLSTLTIVGLTGCQLTIAAPEQSNKAPASATPSYSTPVIAPGHDAAAIAAKDLDWQAGNALSMGVPVEWNDQLSQNQTGGEAAPVWAKVISKRAGLSRYQNANGCLLDYWQTQNQQALMVVEDDRSSTLALFKYLLPELDAEGLKDTDWPWSKDAGKPSPIIQFLSMRKKAAGGRPASYFSARMLNHSGVGLVLSVACPSDALLEPTLASARNSLTVLPPQQ